MVSFRELVRRLAADGIIVITHQRVSQISKEDPENFPPVMPIGRSKAVDYRLAAPYFRKRVTRPGWRTDLKGKPSEAEE